MQQPPRYPPPGHGPNGAVLPAPLPRQRWHDAVHVVVLSLLCCLPAGLGFLWGSPNFAPNVKKAITGGVIGVLALSAVTIRHIQQSATPGDTSARPPIPAPASASTGASLKGSGWPAPSRACGLLADMQLTTLRGWLHLEPEWGCATNQLLIGASGIQENRVVLLGSGTETQVETVRLTLYLNNREAEYNARRSLVYYANALFERTMGKPIPGQVETSILTSTPGKWRFDDRDIDLERDDYPAKNGYAMHLTVMVPGNRFPK